MEEDIKILKEIKEEYDYAFGTKIYRPHSISREEIQAIENILNRLEQDERVIEEMGEYIHITQHCKFLFGGKRPIPYLKEEIIDHFRKKCE